jgi:flagellar biosynthesis/type III secretory pathway chaperone
MESLKEVIQTLETMTAAHTGLLELAKEKRNILVDGNIQSLQSLVYRESSFVVEIEKLELQRSKFVQEYLDSRGLPGDSFTLEDLMETQDNPASKATLKNIAKQLRFLIQEITHLNESNQQLIHTSLSYLQYTIGMFVRKEPAIGYGPHAKNRYFNLLDAKV